MNGIRFSTRPCGRARACVLVAAAVLSSCTSARAQGVSGTVDAFVTEYVRAFNAKDVARLRSLMHAASVQCIKPDARYFYDEMLATHIRDPIPAGYRFDSKPVDPARELPGNGWADFPIRPSREIHLTFSRGPEDSSDLIIWVVRERGQWYQVEPCLTTSAIETLRADEPARQTRIAQAKARVAAIEEPLRSELKALIRQGKTITAQKQYQAATGADLETAMLVIYDLTPEAIR